jgi:hypothetical protein
MGFDWIIGLFGSGDERASSTIGWKWARQDSNLRPSPCQGDVLTRLRRRGSVLDDEPRLDRTMMAYQAFAVRGSCRLIGTSYTAYTSSMSAGVS